MRIFAKDALINKSSAQRVDCSDWSSLVSTNSQRCRDAIYAYNKYYVIKTKTLYESSNATSWTGTTIISSDSEIRKFAPLAGSERFIALCGINYNSNFYYGYGVGSNTGEWTLTRFSTTGTWKDCVFTDVSEPVGYSNYFCGFKSTDNGNVGVIARYYRSGSGASITYSLENPTEIATKGLRGIEYLNGNLIAFGDEGYIAIYSSGSWNVRQVGNGSDSWRAMAYGDGTYVLISYDGYAVTSKDLTSWTSKVNTNVPNPSLTFGYHRFFVGGDIGKLSGSFDGVNWVSYSRRTDYTTPLQNEIECMCYGNGKVVAGNYKGDVFYKTWKAKV